MFKFLLAYTDISTHTPHARRDSFVSFHFEKLRISTHTPHARRDNSSVYHIPVQYRFLLTRLMRGVTLVICVLTSMLIISTHTPHARRDEIHRAARFLFLIISTHTPHARRDDMAVHAERKQQQFLLTRLMRGVTPHLPQSYTKKTFLLTRLMRGVTRKPYIFYLFLVISTHTPHARRDNSKTSTTTLSQKFLLTRLMRGVTIC